MLGLHGSGSICAACLAVALTSSEIKVKFENIRQTQAISINNTRNFFHQIKSKKENEKRMMWAAIIIIISSNIIGTLMRGCEREIFLKRRSWHWPQRANSSNAMPSFVYSMWTDIGHYGVVCVCVCAGERAPMTSPYRWRAHENASTRKCVQSTRYTIANRASVRN